MQSHGRSARFHFACPAVSHPQHPACITEDATRDAGQCDTSCAIPRLASVAAAMASLTLFRPSLRQPWLPVMTSFRPSLRDFVTGDTGFASRFSPRTGRVRIRSACKSLIPDCAVQHENRNPSIRINHLGKTAPGWIVAATQHGMSLIADRSPSLQTIQLRLLGGNFTHWVFAALAD